MSVIYAPDPDAVIDNPVGGEENGGAESTSGQTDFYGDGKEDALTEENAHSESDAKDSPNASEDNISGTEDVPSAAEESPSDAEDGQSEVPEPVTIEKVNQYYVDMSVKSGVAPLEVRFSQINSCYRRLPMAYRSYIYINSVTEGVLSPERYAYAAETSDNWENLATWSIKAAIRNYRKFTAAGRHVEFITARVPAKLALSEDLYTFMKTLLEEEGFDAPEKLCLEFPRTVLYEDEEKVRSAMLDMKLLRVRTMMSGCGEKDCPVTSLINVPVDFVILAPWLTVQIDSRSHGKQISALIGFLRSLSIEVIADGVLADPQISLLNRADCMGYIPSSGYEGPVMHGRLRMTLKEALAQKEDDG